MKMRIITTITMFLFLSGCETMNNGAKSSYPSTKNFSVNIISEPSGAKIEINNNYVGKTPIIVKLEGWETTRTFERSHTIVAHPVRAGGQIQSKWFSGWYEPDKRYGDIIPKKIYFNMNLVRMPQKHEIYINK